MPSLLADAPFEQLTLTYQTEGTAGTDAHGNPILLPGTPGTLSTLFAPFKATQIERVDGSDPKVIPGRGELIDPITLPAGVGIGSVLTCTYAGYSCTATLTAVIPNDLVGVNFGTYFEVDVRVLS
jgi:hypothetical protein